MYFLELKIILSEKPKPQNKKGKYIYKGVIPDPWWCIYPSRHRGAGHCSGCQGEVCSNKNQARQSLKHPGRHWIRNNIIKELLDNGSDGDLWFQ